MSKVSYPPPCQVCPMNTSPFVDSRKTSQEIWEEFSLSFTPAVQEVVDFAKRIPGFRDLPENDQVGLLKAGTFEVGGQNSTPSQPLQKKYPVFALL